MPLEPETAPVRLDVFADPTCPWSLIGKAELDRALESRPQHPFALVWHPFRLEPQMPAAGMDYVTYMKARYRDEKGILEAMGPVMAAAERLGLWINPSLIERVPDTTNAFRLLHWAGIEGAQTRVMSGLMRAYWREGQNISRPDVLGKIAQGAGMDGAVAERLLTSDADIDTVLLAEGHARDRGVRSTPTFIVADHHVVTGAQPSDLWLRVIDELAQTKG